jgi:hypothetical protein
MYSHMNEDVMWERLKDLQLEAENSRLTRPRLLPAAWRAATQLAGLAWILIRGVHPRWWAQLPDVRRRDGAGP